MEKLTFKLILVLLSIFIFLIGGITMLFCLRYLYSNNLASIIGAGIPFLSGTLMTVGGIISLAILLKENKIN
ncbi:hypothetical protein [Flammeovirga agarivorans]|uniref:Uncharacterized protein n=1 Tax=Flammeovirga agarivorans TaxID=2726742 RepID=A0A7X8SRF4_9BACT|nr:hypothetical protein [Flammeovirga agarivorans]NLR95036.1 hypothetical protein [Flammeovirga agarivorans]